MYNYTLKVHDIGIQTLISDFGFSTIKGIKNQEVDTLSYKSNYGIYNESHRMYDVQYFLNSIRQEIKNLGLKSGTEALQFIERVLPAEYLGKESSKIKNHRLRSSPLGHPNLPSFKQVFNDRFFSPYKKASIPFDISTIIGRRKSSSPKSIVVKHGGGKVTYLNFNDLKNLKYSFLKNLKEISLFDVTDHLLWNRLKKNLRRRILNQLSGDQLLEQQCHLLNPVLKFLWQIKVM